MVSYIISDVRALALHYKTLDRLQNRADILGDSSVKASVQSYLPRLLVAGLDYNADPGSSGWPLPTGGRYRKLCFSPLIEDLAKAKLANLGVFELPVTKTDFEEYVSLTTGFSSEYADDLYRIFRLDPGMLYDSCRQMRLECPPAWRLLLSNEFTLAAKMWPALRKSPQDTAFKHPLIHGFMFLAEQERASLIMRRLARADAIMDRPKLLEALKSGQPLDSWFGAKELPEVFRWLEYACFSTEALRGLLFDRGVDEILALPAGDPLWTVARGGMPTPIANVIDDPAVRACLVRVFTRPPHHLETTERRRQILRDDHIVRWYGMTNEVLPILALEGARERLPTRKTRAPKSRSESSIFALTRLSSAIRSSWDGPMQAAIVGAARAYSSKSGKEVTLEANLRLGKKRALTYLPSTGRLGSAARFNFLMWDAPGTDDELWSMFIAPTGRPKVYKLDHPERHKVKASFAVLRRVFAPVAGPTTHSELVLKIANDLGAAVSAISANPQIAFAIAKLDLVPDVRKRLGFCEPRAQFGPK